MNPLASSRPFLFLPAAVVKGLSLRLFGLPPSATCPTVPSLRPRVGGARGGAGPAGSTPETEARPPASAPPATRQESPQPAFTDTSSATSSASSMASFAPNTTAMSPSSSPTRRPRLRAPAACSGPCRRLRWYISAPPTRKEIQECRQRAHLAVVRRRVPRISTRPWTEAGAGLRLDPRSGAREAGNGLAAREHRR